MILSLLCVLFVILEDQGASPVNVPSVGSYQSSGKRKVHSKKKKGTITANIAGSKYEIGMTPHIYKYNYYTIIGKLNTYCMQKRRVNLEKENNKDDRINLKYVHTEIKKKIFWL